ncbi:MAG TPA: hypothetical protein VLZ54_03360, partial [Arenibacter sp.]|nr:hypothetical protein [Arenibacter sp.]
MSYYKPIVQSFKVPYEYKLHFTEHVFKSDNTLFRDLILDYNPKGEVKVLFVIDSGVLEAHSKLSDQITAYCQKYSGTIKGTEQIVVPGGEQCKNDYGHIERILQAINDNRICRHSFVVAIGGGAIIDMAGYAAAIA